MPTRNINSDLNITSDLTVAGEVEFSGLSTASVSPFVVSDGGSIGTRTTAQVLSDIAALPLEGGTVTGNLNVSGSSSVLLRVRGGARIALENASATDSFYISNTGGSGASKLDLGGAVSIIEGGNVGIGTTSPEKNLSIGNAQAEGIQFNYDTTNNYRNQILNYWNSTADSRMDFNIARTSGQTPVTIMSVGYNSNVGIGTTSPSAKLQVFGTSAAPSVSGTFQGSIFSIKGSSTVFLDMGTTGASGYYAWMQAHDAGTGVNYKLAINPLGGNVGIGTTSPARKLHVSTGNTDVAARFENTTSNGNVIEVKTSGDNKTLNIQSDHIYSNMALHLGSDSYNTYIRGTNVGVGTTSPFTTGGTAKLSVSGMISWGSSSSDLSYFRRLSAGNFQWQTYNGGNSGNIHLQPYGGNVGIGTTSPSAKLHVVTNNSAAQLYLQRTGSITGNYRLGVAGATNRFYITDVAQSQDRLVINESGNVGIGTTSPNSPLSVQSNSGGGAARFIGRSSDSISGLEFFNNAESSSVYLQGNGSWFRSRADGGFHFARGVTPTTSDTDGFTINGLNVGIGVTNPQAYLDIRGGGAIFSTTLTNNDDWSNSPVSILERDVVGAGQSADKYSPNLNFHWTGRISNSLWMASNGYLNWGSFSSSGIPSADGVFQAATGRFNQLHIQGGYALGSSANFLYIDPNTQFSSGIYINNAVKVDGGLLGSYNEDLQLRTGANTRLTLSSSTGNATFAADVDVNGITTSDAFRTDTSNTDYNVISRNSTSNTLWVQAAQSNSIQGIASFRYGSATVNAGTEVCAIRKNSSYFINTKLGVGTNNPATTLDVEGTIKHKVYTVSTLPSASPAGQRAFISDNYYNLQESHGMGVYSGGSNFVPVYSDGSNWKVG